MLNNLPGKRTTSMLTIKRANRTDFKEVLQLRMEFYEDHLRYDPLLKPVTDRGVHSELTKEIRAYLAGGNSRKALFVAVKDSEYLGYLMVKLEGVSKIFRHSTEGFIPNIYVRPSATRKKVGSELVKAAHTWIRSHGGEVVRLVVYTDNSAGEKFWLRTGYIPHQFRMYTSLG